MRAAASSVSSSTSRAEITDLDAFKDADLIVAADGINSFIRERYKEHFQPEIELRRNHFIWLGTSAPTSAFSFHFTTNEFGIWDLCTYQYKQDMCTWVIEAPDTTWAKAEPVIGNGASSKLSPTSKTCGRICSRVTSWSAIAPTGGAFR